MVKVFNNSFCRSVQLSDHATTWLTLRDRKQQRLFEGFNTSQFSVLSFLVFLLFVTVYTAFAKVSTVMYFPSILSIISAIMGASAPILVGWIILIIHLVEASPKTSGNTKKMLQNILPFLESFYVLITCIEFGLGVVIIGMNGRCAPEYRESFQKSMGCNYSSHHQMPEDMMMVSVILPVLLCRILKGAKWKFQVLAFLINLGLMFFTMFYFDLTISLPALVLYIPICTIIMYENQRQSIAVFLLTQNQQNLLEENERLAAETQANELRHMIGNVAHDLKTPLSAFVSGIDTVGQEITSSLQGLSAELSSGADKKSSSAAHQQRLTTIQDCMTHMRSVNAFMLMTINRCIDYTKASNGLKLVPRLETVNFAEAVALPLSCMRNLQDKKIAITMRPISADIAANIITDNQWLQENLLCLLSNAVRYTAQGSVTVSVSLVESESKECDSVSGAAATITNNSSGSQIRMEVEDTGIGVRPEAAPQIFAFFKQAQRLAGGTGLGLYSLAKRTESLGGSCGMHPRTDGREGSVFWFTIPYRPDHSHVAAGPSSTEHTTPGLTPSDTMKSISPFQSTKSEENKLSGLNILLVDDAVTILKMSGMLLRRQGHTVTTAENGAEALKLMSRSLVPAPGGVEEAGYDTSSVFDVVLMDLQMPVMDGLESTSRLRKLESEIETAASTGANNAGHPVSFAFRRCNGGQSRHHQLIIGVSACSDNETVEAAFAAGIDAFIPKPFTIQSFNETYRSQVAKKRG